MGAGNVTGRGVPISLDSSTKEMLRANAPATAGGGQPRRPMPPVDGTRPSPRPMQSPSGTAAISRAALTGQMAKAALHPTVAGGGAMPDAAEMIYGDVPDEGDLGRTYASEESGETVPKVIDGLLTGTVLLATVLVPFAIVNALVPRVREIITELPFWGVLVCGTVYLTVTFAIAMAIAAAFGCGPVAHAKSRRRR